MATEKPDAKRKSFGAVVAIVGFVLSPLSPWNDLVVNIPISLGMAWLVSWFHPPAFALSFVVAYWFTNVLGLVLMHWGAATSLSNGPTAYGRRQFVWHLVIALGYTAVVVLLIQLRVLAPLPEYLNAK